MTDDEIRFITKGYFTKRELACKCGICDSECDTDKHFLQRLLVFRVLLDMPVLVNSGFRCNKHALQSANHGSGKAVDIECDNSRYRFKVIKAAITAGFRRIGIGETFIHLDDNPVGDQEVVWLY